MTSPTVFTPVKGFYLDENNLNKELGQIMPSSRDVDWQPFIEKMRKDSEKVISGITKEVLDVHPEREAFVLRNVLTKEECDYLIAETESIGYQELHGYSSSYRSNTRRIIYYDSMKNLLWERVKPFLTTKLAQKKITSWNAHGVSPTSWNAHGVSSTSGSNGDGWNAYGLNPQFRFCRYLPGQKFAPHYDGNFVLNSGNRSFYTFMIYLNGGFEGGATRFIDSKTLKTLVSLNPESGLLLIFQHNIYHDGEELRSGAKYLMRSDVMFELEASSQNETAEELLAQEALDLLNQAEQFESQGRHSMAIAYYKKAYKLAPELENKDFSTIDDMVTPSAKKQVSQNPANSASSASTQQAY